MAANPLAGGFSFGSNVNAVKPTPAASGFSFGAPTATTTSSGFSLNLAGTTAAPAATAAPTLGGFSGFGTAKTTQATAVVPPLGSGLSGFGSTAATTPATGFGGFGTAATSVPNSSFGAAAPSTGFAAPSTGLGGGFGGLAAVATTTTTAAAAAPKATLGLGGNSVAPTFSLGGSQTSQASAGAAPVSTTESAKTDQIKNVKDCMIPIELDNTVEQVKKHMKDEKGVCSDISHYSDKAYTKIKQETDALSQLVTILSIGIHKNRSTLDKLKLSSAQELVNTDIACRTKETAASMQYENVAPMDYFMRLVAQFETDMTEYRKQIDQTQQQLQLMSSGGGVTSADISLAIQKLYSVFTELAARYQGIHVTLMKCKEQYIAVHRRVHGASVPAFEKSSSCNPVPSLSTASLSKLTGPSPFSAPSDPLIQARQIVPNKGQSNMGPPTLGLNVTGTPTGAFGGTAGAVNTSAFGSGNVSATNNTTGFGGNTTAFGGNTTGFGGNISGFGGNATTGFGNTTGFGGNTTGFGGNTTAFGGTSTGLVGNTTGFGSNTTFGSPGFGSSTFGSPSSFGSPTVGSKRNKI